MRIHLAHHTHVVSAVLLRCHSSGGALITGLLRRAIAKPGTKRQYKGCGAAPLRWKTFNFTLQHDGLLIWSSHDSPRDFEKQAMCASSRYPNSSTSRHEFEIFTARVALTALLPATTASDFYKKMRRRHRGIWLPVALVSEATGRLTS